MERLRLHNASIFADIAGQSSNDALFFPLNRKTIYIAKGTTMNASRSVQTIRKEIGKGRQAYTYTETLKVGTHTCQICIKSDAYNFQSYAKASVWSNKDLCWNPVASIHYSQMSTKDGLIYKQSMSGTDELRDDRDNLLDQLLNVLE